jgi:hypothetical protein
MQIHLFRWQISLPHPFFCLKFSVVLKQDEIIKMMKYKSETALLAQSVGEDSIRSIAAKPKHLIHQSFEAALQTRPSANAPIPGAGLHAIMYVE